MAFIPNGFDVSDGVSLSELGQNGLPPGTIPPIGVTLSSPTVLFNDTHLIVCFTRGTLIKTPEGEIPIEKLCVGDLVATMDDGCEAIRWIGSTKRDEIDFAINPKLRPVRIPAGAFGSGLPHQDLLVSRQHRMLVRSKVADRVFGAPELLVPAIHFVGFNGIHEACDVEQVEYYHILFEKHEIVWANGSPAESLFTGPEALKALEPEVRNEITELFPEIVTEDYEPIPARLIPKKGKDIRKLFGLVPI
ncbi:Hint domain-containing protein [Rhodobacteraceae bacterium MYP1-1]|uniref:Hint domain-containing protein n=2 Tax=Halocynthiibacter styelae TaxID=2761955 RepID=A0A8J7J1T5_9RHOB|nr:Hint domain-containing protein [Paenihalocynthiibacter styelae]